ncbi:MAG: CDF family Co(II)/Ni(II) efflux transporter DmeF [Burkholderiales bacterium]|nr:CDF family Co(II)/Ni(II) efflux transporter DmeF [Burkholderiales bacterium]
MAHDAEHASLERWRQARAAAGDAHREPERRARIVLVLTLVTMIAELVAGYFTGSMALLADGWHMGTHAAALGITAFAYAYARRHAQNERFSFGTGKVGALAGYSSALLLAVVAVLMAVEAASRLLDPVAVHFGEAIVVAIVGLVVNVISVFLLDHRHAHGSHGHGPHAHAAPHGHGHGHGHDHDQDHGHGHAPRAPQHEAHAHDHNLRSAYLHVLADAVTSVAAIIALIAARWLGWVWLDPGVAIAASVLIGWWAWGLLRSSGRVLVDAEEDVGLRDEIVRLVEADADNRVADIRVWSIGGADRAAIISVVTHTPRSAEHYKSLVSHLPGLQHVTAEVFACPDEPCGLHRVG